MARQPGLAKPVRSPVWGGPPADGGAEGKSYGVCMETIWNSYGTPMDQYASNALATRQQDACHTLAQPWIRTSSRLRDPSTEPSRDAAGIQVSVSEDVGRRRVGQDRRPTRWPLEPPLPSVPGCNTSSTRIWNAPSVTTISFLFKAHGSLAHPDAIEERPGTDCVRVRVGGRARLADNVVLQKGESRRPGQIRAALQEIGCSSHALPGHVDSRPAGHTSGSQHSEG